MGANVLIIEDEAAIVDFVVDNLRQDDHQTQSATSVREALVQLRRTRPDIVLVDIGLPDGSGLDIIRSVRGGEAGDPGVGIILLTARAEEQDRLRGFARGADDYVTKPFSYPELLARIAALHARLVRSTSHDVICVGALRVDVSARRASVDGQAIGLPAKEFELLVALARDPERVFEKTDLLERVWGYRNSRTTRTLDSHASRLRRRLEDASPGSRFIINRWGVGYALVAGV